jgi:hypothetical protein
MSNKRNTIKSKGDSHKILIFNNYCVVAAAAAAAAGPAIIDGVGNP